ncbi:hypothetical protein A1Q1_00060 [Trichosporon asahii var. asahii CBS 2479]|uniref:Major facilitator superfamily (MFS) profile domain-containing protein n=1 Tax=Trichosporon asahii var. asahii (strain ATCC 90039 / CBS 2479 / JCM 2466 / KCTC 7840 / NBRC 103889/ NCYC 2677 / UAMH 7654) TaxID=1186058 RepID=J8QH68_TRIAS|nr:hypothetical protein A1Q1_00060 [Trichosporon asahii var. asahii CBS 2479]EJT53053.1 hypothetical protein A1Q1_00060 [Trichosporon asahii var. asahii CBS 2479]
MPGASERTPLIAHGNGRANGNGAVARGPKAAVGNRPPPLKYELSTPRFVAILAGIWSSNFVFALQSTAIPVLAPTLASQFAHSELTSYLGFSFSLTNTLGIPVYGVLLDSLGRRDAMTLAALLFGLGSLMCGLSRSIWSLIAWRAVSGLGGGGLLACSAVILTDLVELQERGFYQGIMMTIFGLGALLGGPVSGWIMDKGEWPWAFYLQLPIVLFCIVTVRSFLPDRKLPSSTTAGEMVRAQPIPLSTALKGLDFAGIATLFVSFSALIVGLSFHTAFFLPWSDIRVAGLLAIAAVTSQMFLFYVPLYFSLIGASGSASGLVVSICSGVGLALGSLIGGWYIRRGVGSYTRLGKMALVPPILTCAIAATEWTSSWPQWAYYATVLPSNLGYAVFLVVSLVSTIASVDAQTMPKATALLYTVRSLGATLGISLGGCVQIWALVRQLRKRFYGPGSRKLINNIVRQKSFMYTLPEEQRQQAVEAYLSSLRATWAVAAALACCTLLASTFIKEKRLPGKQQLEQAQQVQDERAIGSVGDDGRVAERRTEHNASA